jgi:hypothetical protein
VVALTANLALEIPGRTTQRIFPRGAMPATDARSAASGIGPRLTGQLDALVASGRPVQVSLTAGRDSRVSLAASRSRRDELGFFTYTRAGTAKYDWDVTTAKAMAAELGLRHRVVEILPEDPPPELRDALTEATGLGHGGAVVAAYRRSFPSDTIHIRSNIGEVGRSYYLGTATGRKVAATGGTLTADDIARIWAHQAPVSPTVVEAFDEWMQAIGFRDVEGMDPLDVLYWEHRMARWHSNKVLESDFAFDTHVLFNARSILRQMVAVPAEERASSSVFALIVAELWPELTRWPHKPDATPRSKAPVPRSPASRLRRRIGRLVGR